MSRVEDIVRHVLARRAEGPAISPPGLDAVLAASRRRTVRRRTTTAGIVAIAASMIGVTAFVVRDDDDQPIVTTPPSSTSSTSSSVAPETSTTNVGPTTSTTVETPVASEGDPPETIVVGFNRQGLALLDAQSGEMIRMLHDYSDLPVVAEAHNTPQIERAPDGVVWYTITSGPEDYPSLWRVDPDGGDPEKIAEPAGSASVSADSRYLAYATSADGETGYARDTLVVRDLTDGSERRWTAPVPARELGGGGVGDLSWRHDGQAIAFGFSDDSYTSFELYILNVSTMKVGGSYVDIPLTSDLAWTADGTILAIDGDTRALVAYRDGTRLTDYALAAGLDGLELRDIDLDATGVHLVAVTARQQLYVGDANGTARQVADRVTAAAW